MKPIARLLVFGLAGLSGCVSAASTESLAIAIVPIRSQSVAVLQPRLAQRDGQLVLQGSVYRLVNAKTTASTHLDVVFLDSTGRPLREEIAYFAPRKLHHAPRPPAGRGHYRVPMPALPPRTATIEVRAHDGEHVAHG